MASGFDSNGLTTMSNPSLVLGLSGEVTRARLTASEGREADLRRLALNFRTCVQRSPSSIEIDIDELLTSLEVLNRWPHTAAGDVEWDPQLRTLVVDSIQDSQSVSSELEGEEWRASYDEATLSELIGSEWIGELTSFQQRDIAKLLALRHGANFSVPGAGKTRVGLAVFSVLRKRDGLERLLIVGPKSSFNAWQYENLECMSPALSMDFPEEYPSESADAVVINYERLPRMVGALSRWLAEKPSMIVLDEAHRMKLGAEGAYGSACLALGPRSNRRLILTGTPAPNGVKDLENLFGFVWPGMGRQSVRRAVGAGSLAAASRALNPLFVRTTKSELNLPPVDTVLRRVALPPLHAEIYRALVGQFSARAFGAEGDFQALGRIVMYMLMAATSPALLAEGSSRYEPLAFQVPPLPVPGNASLYELMRELPAYEVSPKYQEVLKIVTENVAQGRKTLVWSTFIRNLETLRGMLASYVPAVVHGGTVDREEQIRRFRTDPSCMVLLSNAATLGEGISLHHECHDAVYVDRDFAAGRFLQSLDRIHRLGLSQDVLTRITVLVSEGTIDEVVAARLARKLEFMGGVLDDPAVQQLADLDEEDTRGSGLDQRDLQALIGYLRSSAA
ncbi:DEAD/DEAH box helicase [Tomitella cavernea]|uniref:DEAD/DEAH box helicase n=1 Tax=Tomitella cavernea TaxID=1387982 RepID=A0ABP9C747_9ACTN|nr:DEAD/DEAH box helicase [Tomitella cavernea]